jgi:hypothetical protein
MMDDGWMMDDGRMMDGSADDLDPELNVTSNLVDVNQGQTSTLLFCSLRVLWHTRRMIAPIFQPI